MIENTPARKEGMNIQSIERAMNILRYIGGSGNSATLKAISAEMGLSHSTVHNILKTLKQGGFVTQAEAGAPYSLGYAILDLYRQMSVSDLLLRATKFDLDTLSAKYNESCSLAIYDNFEVLYLYNTECNHEIRLVPAPGMRSPAYATACGKMLLASLSDKDLNLFFANIKLRAKTSATIIDPDALREELQKVRERGYSFDNYELSETTRCYGAPIYNPSGKVVAAISLSFPDHRSNGLDESKILRDVLHTAARISELNGYRPRHFG